MAEFSSRFVDKTGIGGAKEPLEDRARPWSGARPLELGHIVHRQQRFKIRAVEVRAPIDDQRLWQTPIAADALAQYHHIGAIAWGIIGQVGYQHTPRVGIDEERTPRPPQHLARARMAQNDIQFRVI